MALHGIQVTIDSGYNTAPSTVHASSAAIARPPPSGKFPRLPATAWVGCAAARPCTAGRYPAVSTQRTGPAPPPASRRPPTSPTTRRDAAQTAPDAQDPATNSAVCDPIRKRSATSLNKAHVNNAKQHGVAGSTEAQRPRRISIAEPGLLR